MEIKVEALREQLAAVEQQTQDHVREILKHLRDTGKKYSLNGYRILDASRNDWIIKSIYTDDPEDVRTYELDVQHPLNADEIHVFCMDAFDTYELFHLIDHIKNNLL